MKRSVLVVAAHPDDELLGCGGAVARHAGQGDIVTSLILGEGATSRSLTREQAVLEEAGRLEKCALSAAKILGVQEVVFGHLADNRFDTVALLDIVKIIERIKAAAKPDVVYTHFYGDRNIDHRLTYDAVCTAFRPLPGEKQVSIFAFETVSSTEWPDGRESFRPNAYLPLERAQLDKKLAAAAAYSTEMRPPPHPRSLAVLEALAVWRGITAGVPLAEAFEVTRLML